MSGAHRILVACGEFPPVTGGIASLCHAACVALARMEGVDLHLFVPAGSSDVPGATVHRLCERPRSALGARGTVRTNARRLGELARRYGFDRVVFMDACARALAAAPEISTDSSIYVHGTELVVSSRGGELLSGRFASTRRALSLAGRILVNSAATGRLLERALPGADYEVVHPCFNPGHVYDPDVHTWNPYAGLDGRFVFLTVSRLAPRKGHDRVAEILARLRPRLPPFVWCVVGDGPSREAIERSAVSRGIRDSVVFAGRVPDWELGAYYRHADLFVMLSKRAADGVEGFGLSFIEAGMSGTAAVGSDHGGVVEAVLDGITGMTVGGDLAEASERILALVQDPERRRLYASVSARRARRELTPDAFARALLSGEEGARGSGRSGVLGTRWAS